MCIIIVKPAGETLTKKMLRNSWDNNDDGAGFVYARNGSLVIFKELYSFKKFWKAYNQSDLDQENVVLHFRVLSSGKHDINNVHPFLVDDNHALVHNGILGCVKVPLTSDVNDTQIFIDEYLRCMVDSETGGPVDWVNNRFAREYAESVIGKWNKMAVINSLGEVCIWNEGDGHWEGGCWFSNYTYSYGKYRGKTWDFTSTYSDKWVDEWDRTAFRAEPTFLVDDTPKKIGWPESKYGLPDNEETDIDETYSQRCLECGTILTKSEITAGWGCCEECVQKAYDIGSLT